jgi:ribosomal protein L7/L12
VALLLVCVLRLPRRRRSGERTDWHRVQLEARLDAVLQHLGVSVADPLPARVRDLLRAGRKIDAIKVYRDQTATGLREAKQAVEQASGDGRLEAQIEALVRHYGLVVPDTVPDQVRALLRAGQKIEAIRVYRQAHGCQLKDAKDAVDAMERALA